MPNLRLPRVRRFIIAIILFTSIIFVLVKHLKDTSDITGYDIDHHNKELELSLGQKRLAVIVPFRDRFDELFIFVPYLSKFISAQEIKSFNIIIVNQSRRYRFNRGALTNVGFILAQNISDYIAIHDVDILPLNKNLSYKFPEYGPYHLSAPEYHPQYNYSTYFGGVLLINNQHFKLVNGMSNRYFGWGLEDDEFYLRIRAAKLNISRPIGLATNRTNTLLHLHHNKRRDSFKTKEQKEILRKRDKITGLNDSKFSLNSKYDITIDGYKCKIFNVEIFCDIDKTPWCSRNFVKST